MLDTTFAAMNPLAATVGVAALKGAVIVVLAAIVVRLLRNRSASARHAVWATAVLAHIVLLAAPLLPKVDIPVLPATSAAVEVTESAGVPATAMPGNSGSSPAQAPVPDEPATAPLASAASPSEGLTTINWPTVLLLLWLAGMTAVLVRYLVGTAQVARIARSSARVNDGSWLALTNEMATSMGIERPLTLRRGTRFDIPVTWGILYPIVMLPADAEEWSEEQRRFVLAHELAHVKRLDALTQLLTQVAVALFWFSPFVWYAAARIRAEREHACDDEVILQGTVPSYYAQELLDMVRSIGERGGKEPGPALAALAMARRSEFEGRMLAILDPRTPRGALSRAATAAIGAVLVLIVVPAAMVRPVAAAPIPAAASLPRASESIPPAASALPAASAQAPTATAIVEGPKYKCSADDLERNGTHTSINATSVSEEFIIRASGKCAHAWIYGDVSLSDDLRDLASLAPGAWAEFHELVPGFSRKLRVTRAADGALVRQYSENGRGVDASRSSSWFSEFLRTLVTTGGFAVDRRVVQLRSASGVQAVLREARATSSSGVRRKYYEHLLKSEPRLTTAEANSLLRDATELIAGSGDMRSLVQKAMDYSSPSPAELSRAIRRIESDGDRSSLLRRALQDPERAVVLLAVQEAARIHSDGDKAGVLIRAAEHALSDPELRAAFYESAATIDSDGDKRRVLVTAARHSPKSRDAISPWLRVVAGIDSDGDKSATLITGIREGFVIDSSLRS
jgi:beta-lactamase regulating signal transducer with metallopeptidase domain